MSQAKKVTLSIVSLLACLAGPTIYATPTMAIEQTKQVSNVNIQEFKLQPRFNVWGFTGDETYTKGQFLAPLYGAQSRALYAIGEGHYVSNDDSWMGGAGLGYRQVVNDRIYGGYGIVDYVSSPHVGFTVLNPGLEMLGNIWDFNVNGYLLVRHKKKLAQEGFGGSTFGDYSHVVDYSHNQDDDYMKRYEEPGQGVDFEIARVVPYFTEAKIHMGAYHFATVDAGSTNGVKARLTYDLNHYTSLEVANKYDNTKHNQLTVGVHFTLGAYSKEEKQQFGIASRLLDPIERSNMVIKSKLVNEGRRKEHDNIWYFKSDSSPKASTGPIGDGTAEKPFIGFTPENEGAIDPRVGGINKFPLMYFAPGHYSFNGFNPQRSFTLENGWGMYGRAVNYSSPAKGIDRASFDGVLGIAAGNNETTLNSIRIAPNGMIEALAILTIQDATNVILQNIDVQCYDNLIIDGIKVEDSTINFMALNNVDPGETTIYTNKKGNNGISVLNGTVNFNGGINTISGGTRTNGEGGNNANGMSVGKRSTINFQGGTNTILGGDRTGMWKNSVNGMSVGQLSTINFQGGTNTISGGTITNDEGGNNANGMSVTGNSTINFQGGTNIISGGANGGGVVNSNGMSVAGNSTINFQGGTNTISGGDNEGGVVSSNGMYVASSSINFQGGTNTISGGASDSTDSGHGIYLGADSIVTFANLGKNPVTINVKKDDADGIFAGETSYLKYVDSAGTHEFTNFHNIDNYASFSHTSTGGYAIEWNSLKLNWPQ